MTVKHAKTSAIPDSGDAGLVQPSDWNADHAISGGLDLPLETVTAPASDNVRLFGAKVGGRMMPAFEGSDGVASVIQPSFATRRVSMWTAGSGTTATQIALVSTQAGTATAATLALTNAHTKSRRIDYLVTTASTSAAANWVSIAPAGNHYCRSIGFFASMRAGGATGMATSTHRFYMGITGYTGSAADAEPSSRNDIIGAGYDSADANFQLMHKDGSGAVTKVDLGAAFPRQIADRSKMYDLQMYAAPNGSSVFYQFTDLETGAVASGEITTNLPPLTTFFKFTVTASVGGTSSVIGYSLAQFYLETDY